MSYLILQMINPLQKCTSSLINIRFPLLEEFFLSKIMYRQKNKLIFPIAGFTEEKIPFSLNHYKNPSLREFFLSSVRYRQKNKLISLVQKSQAQKCPIYLNNLKIPFLGIFFCKKSINQRRKK